MRKLNKWKVVVLLIMALIVTNFVWNQGIGVTRYNIQLPQNHHLLAGLQFVQLSDIHSIRTEKQATQIINKVAEQNPKFITVTGDLVDFTYYNKLRDEAKQENRVADNVEPMTTFFMQQLLTIAPVYYIYGNHERALLYDEPNGFVSELQSLGIQFLNNEQTSIIYENEELQLFGVNDVASLPRSSQYAKIANDQQRLEEMLKDGLNQLDQAKYTILLSHRPEFYDVYKKLPIDLVLTGHAHGGQMRLPFVGGLFAPGQGILPKYTSGVFNEGRVHMIVNRGIGNSSFPVRVFNRPEIIVVTLTK